jgi:hypothetical protein
MDARSAGKLGGRPTEAVLLGKRAPTDSLSEE